MSPSRNLDNGPPTALSGTTCSTTVPNPVPLIRPSVIRSMSVTPWPSSMSVTPWPSSPDGAVTELVGGVGLSNGLDWSDDRKTFYYADGLSGGVDAFGTDQDTGALVSQVTSAAFGGADLSTLYITTAREGFTAADRQAQPHAGDIFACTPGVTGRLPYLFGA